MKKAFLFILILITLGGVGYFSYSYFFKNTKIQTQTKNPQDRSLVSVTRGEISDQVTVPGEITTDSRNSLEVKGEVSGKIKKIHPVIGDVVKKGDLLIELDERDLLTEKETAQRDIDGNILSLDKSKRLFERSEKLFAKKLVSLQDFENSKTDYLIAQNNYEKAQSRLQSVIDKIEKTKIRAPMDGTVIVLPVVNGQVIVGAGSVNAGTLLMTIADLSKMIIQCHMNQVDIVYVKEDQNVTFRVVSVNKSNQKGTVNIIAPTATVKNNLRGYGVTIKIEELDPSIRPGMSADVTFTLKTVTGALLLPLQAIFSDNNGDKVVYVHSLNPEADLEKRVVKTGIISLQKVEITSGLQEGDRVSTTRPLSNEKK